MEKEFNTEGSCIPGRHYLVDISQKLEAIFPLVQKGKYFTINRPRQYGKTTTLFLLANLLNEKEEYLALNLSFEGIGDEVFTSEKQFCQGFLDLLKEEIEFLLEPLHFFEEKKEVINLQKLGKWVQQWVKKHDKKIVLFIDEVDKSSDNQLFLSFLGMLRDKYLKQGMGDYTFHSVILAGVYDVKTLKLKLLPKEEKKYNSPWNIAAEFDVEMDFSPEEIATMLQDHHQEKKIEMNIPVLSEKLFYYTSGHPFLVSKLCKLMDEKWSEKMEWDEALLDQAVHKLLQERTTNFDHLKKNLEEHDSLYQLAFDLLIEGQEITYNVHNSTIELGELYGIVKNEDSRIKIHNRVYQLLIYNYLTSEIELSQVRNPYDSQTHFLNPDGNLNFEKVLLKFQEFMKLQYSEKDQKFLERNGRLIFLAFLKPIINGKGFDFKEVETSEEKRLDVVVTFYNKRFVVELKRWKGEKAHQKGIQQLNDYLDRLNLTEGYLLIFDQRKKQPKKWDHETVRFKEKDIFIVWA